MIYSVKAVVDCYKSYEIPLVVSLLPKGLLMENAFIDTRKDALGVRLSSGGGFRFLALAASVGNHFFHRRDFGVSRTIDWLFFFTPHLFFSRQIALTEKHSKGPAAQAPFDLKRSLLLQFAIHLPIIAYNLNGKAAAETTIIGSISRFNNLFFFARFIAFEFRRAKTSSPISVNIERLIRILTFLFGFHQPWKIYWTKWVELNVTCVIFFLKNKWKLETFLWKRCLNMCLSPFLSNH